MATKYVDYLYHITTMATVYIPPCSHIGHFVLTERLLPLLKSTALEEGSDVRIVNVRRHAKSILMHDTSTNIWVAQVTSVAHDRVHPESFVGKDSINKNYGDSFNGYLDTYGRIKPAVSLTMITDCFFHRQRPLQACQYPTHQGATAKARLGQHTNRL